ncbi:hypothetical protein [Catenuloplanes atrovinosus]|uniref:hypothetical protein n=1 Tax=Catenuloplanes atrovinosus TaxID=137266 RepID=UPI00286BC751|nr:hypothetical protein [Catenuloplanes atrovinosus]
MATRRGRARLLGPDGAPIGDEIRDIDGDGATRMVRRLEHVAGWRQVLALDNPGSTLAGAVSVSLVAAVPGRRPDPDAPALLAREGCYRLEYARRDGAWVAPQIHVRLRNRRGKRLYCVLLNLSGNYRIHARLFPGDFVDPGEIAWAVRGGPIRVGLPRSAPLVPGGRSRDWLKLLVAEEQFGASAFAMPPLGEDVTAARDVNGLDGLLDRLGRRAVHREMDEAEPGRAYDWAALVLPIETVIPG